MKLPENTVIHREKLCQYLLVPRKRNDKSQWLAEAGYTLDQWKILETDLRNQILTMNTITTAKTKFGQMFEIRGELLGPNGNRLSVVTIWMTEVESKTTKFITLYPDKRRR